MSETGCDVECFDLLIDQETFGRSDSPIERVVSRNASNYNVVYELVMRKD